MLYSIIIPVYNRPGELKELLISLGQQKDIDFEVIVVEDGSQIKSEKIIKEFQSQFPIKYYYKENTGPGLSRNYGCDRATGDYLIFLDSDCIVPKNYLAEIDNYLKDFCLDAFGGPDRAHHSFTLLQKAINYSMTSFFTTGGIRGGKNRIDKFYPRSFNMGFTKRVYRKTKGFSEMRFGEDIDMSLRIVNEGFKTGLIEKAFVYHKRRTNFQRFFKQVFNSGIARINLLFRHPKSLKLVHTLPSAFTLGLICILILSLYIHPGFIFTIGFYAFLILIDSFVKNKNISVGILSIPASIIQLTGYGCGFLYAFWLRVILKKTEFSAFTSNFYN